MRKQTKSASEVSTAVPLRCLMLTNTMSGAAAQHARNCSASIRIEKGRYRICEEPGATRHVAWLSNNKDGSERVMACMNVCVECAERLNDGAVIVTHDAVCEEMWEAVA